MLRTVLCILALFGVASHAFATITLIPDSRFIKRPGDILIPISTGEQEFENDSVFCATQGTCSLEYIKFRKEDYVIPMNSSIPDDVLIQGTRIYLGYSTKTVDDLSHYLVVQFTRGCMWYSFVGGDGKLVTEFGVIRGFQNNSRVQHVFPDWVVDSNDADPAYTPGGDPHSRHYLLQWNDWISDWIPSRQGKLFGEERPTRPYGYITDMPGPAYFVPRTGQAINMSLEYKTCLFKAGDVPTSVFGPTIDMDKAVACFRWDAQHVYDHQLGIFKSPRGIHPECIRPCREREEWFRNQHR